MRSWMKQTLVAWTWTAVLPVLGCWPFDYTEDIAAPPRAGSGGGAVGGGGGGDGGGGGAEPGSELFVDPLGGDDAARGTQDAPFRTLGRALSVAASGQTVHLFPGTYGELNGDDFATPVPDGVTVAAVTPGDAVLLGSGGETALAFAGSGAARYLRIEGFDTGVAAEAGAIILTGLELADNVIGVHLSGAAEASLAGATIAGGVYGVYLRGAAKLSMQGGELRDVGPSCGTRAGLSLDATSLTLEGVSVHDNAAWLEVGGVATATIEGSTFTNTGATCGGAIAARDTSRLRLVGTTVEQTAAGGVVTSAIDAVGEDAEITIVGGSLVAVHHAIRGGKLVRIEGATVAGAPSAHCGVCPDMGGTVELVGAQILLFDIGVRARGPTMVRNSWIDANAVGIDFDESTWLDLGTSVDPGGNSLQDNSATALHVGITYAVELQAVGNLWVPGIQGADVNGHFPLGTTFVGPFGAEAPTPRNVVITNAGPSVKVAADLIAP